MLNFRRRLIRRRKIKEIIFFLREYIKEKNIFEISDGIKLCFYIIGDELSLEEQDGSVLFVEYFNLKEINEVLYYLKKQLVEEGYKIHNVKDSKDFSVLYS